MEINQVISMCLVILCSAGFGVMLYFKVRGNLFAAVSELIALAEATNLAGSEKMAQVVQGLMDLVPTPFRKILTAERLETIAQYVFDWMRRYADEYRENTEANSNLEQSETAEEGDTVGRTIAVEIITDLLSLTLAELKEKAEAEYGINLEGHGTKRDYIKEIVAAILRRV